MRRSLRLFAAASPSATPAAGSQTKSRLSPSPKRKAPSLSLDHFLQRQRVLSLYRTILRSLYRIPKDRRERTETIAYARAEFGRNRGVSDVSQIRYLVSTGKAEFDGMKRYIDELAAR